MLLCEGCGKGFHTFCLKIEKPLNYYYCSECTENYNKIPKNKLDITLDKNLFEYLKNKNCMSKFDTRE